MQTVRKLRKRSGFTLVELLIVIIIIGILAGAMLMIAGSGTDRAEATKIISDLRGLKASAMMYYADNNAWPTAGQNASVQLKDYMDRKIDDKYKLVSSDEGFFVGTAVVEGVAKALAGTAEESAIWGSTADNVAPVAAGYPFKDTHRAAWMIINR